MGGKDQVILRALFEAMGKEEEQRADFLEAQLLLIGKVRLDPNLARQIHGERASS